MDKMFAGTVEYKEKKEKLINHGVPPGRHLIPTLFCRLTPQIYSKKGKLGNLQRGLWPPKNPGNIIVSGLLADTRYKGRPKYVHNCMQVHLRELLQFLRQKMDTLNTRVLFLKISSYPCLLKDLKY